MRSLYRLCHAVIVPLLTLVALLMPCKESFAQLGFSNPRALNTNANTDSGDDTIPRVTTDGKGHWVAIWECLTAIGPSYRSDIFVACSSDNGATWTAPTAINNINAHPDPRFWPYDDSPQVTTDGVGHWVAVWHSWGRFGSGTDILMVRSSDNGATWTTPAALNTNVGTRLNLRPKVTTDGTGHWVAVWQSSTLGAVEYDIFVARSSDNGATWTTPTALNTNADTDSGYDGDEFPKVSTDSKGHWVAVWEIGKQIAVARSSDNGATWTAPTPLTTETIGVGGYNVTNDGMGHWVAVWGRQVKPRVAEWDVLLARSSDNGTTWTAPVLYGKALDSVPQITTDGMGHWLAVRVSKGIFGSDYDILMAYSSDNGANWTAPTALNINANTDSGDDMGFEVTTDGKGHWVAVWRSTDDLGGTIGKDSDILVASVFPPIVSSIELVDPNPTSSSLVDFRVNFSELVSGVRETSFMLTSTSGIIGALITSVSCEVDNCTVEVNTGTGNGELRLDLIDDDTIVDADGNALGGWGRRNGDLTGQSYIIDKTAPEAADVSVVSATGPYTIDNAKLVFSWLGFKDSESGIARYEVALGKEGVPEAYQAFTSVGVVNTTTLLASHFPASFPNGIFANGGYLFSIRAVNQAGLVSGVVSTSVTVDPTSFRIGDEIPLPEGKNRDDIDWVATDYNPKTHAIKLLQAKKLLVGDWDKPITVDWHFIDGGKFSRQYNTSSVPVKEPMIIYATHEGQTPTLSPLVDLAALHDFKIHHNEAVSFNSGTPEDPPTIEKNGSRLVARAPKGREPAYVVLQYDTPQGFWDIEIVQVKAARPDVPDGEVAIGSRLLPYTIHTDAVKPIVSRNSSDANVPGIYQHGVIDSPQQGQVWAIRRSTNPVNMEVYWMRKGLGGVIWPYELRRYTAKTWPTQDSTKYQLYVRGEGNVLGPAVDIPVSLNAELIYEDFAVGHAHLPNPSSFYTDGPGWALLKYQTGPPAAPGKDWVGFEVVRSVAHNDAHLFNLTPVPYDIGLEIKDAYHEGPKPGYIHVPEGDRYAPAIYDVGSGGTGQIFAVNKGILEVWWSNLSRTTDPEGPAWPARPSIRVQWPSKVVRYNAVWPKAPVNPEEWEDPKKLGKIIIARQNGTGVIVPSVYGNSWEIYIQNDSTKAGFNPNDEHALLNDDGDKILALRDDLGTSRTSEPYVLLKYKEQPQNTLWRFRVFKVVREEDPYLFKNWTHEQRPIDPYEGIAGVKILAPPGLKDLENGWRYEAVSGPYWQDKNGEYWPMAAGNNNTTADITMRYRYAPDSSFFFPKGPPAPGTFVPWLDNTLDGSGTPVDVTYTIFWEKFHTMKIGQTLINGLPESTAPDMSTQKSADIIYEQSPGSVMLIDPVQARGVDLAELPNDIVRELGGQGEWIFPQLSPSLVHRISYKDGKLKFKGQAFTLDFKYALLNVMSEQERNELLALSADHAWEIAVNTLWDATDVPIQIQDNSVNFDVLALTTGFAKGVGYVTLAMQNCKGTPELDALGVSLEVFKIVPELDPGAIVVIEPDCPFEERLVLRHRGDFGGRPNDYEFEWRCLPDVDGKPSVDRKDYATVEAYLQKWDSFVDKDPATNENEVSITIKGADEKTLSDYWYICRYRYTGTSNLWLKSLGWSDPSPAMLAEGWIKRVMAGVGPFEQRADGSSGGIKGAEEATEKYKKTKVNTVVSMISQAGKRWTGNVPLNCTNLNQFGLIQIYETVFGRGRTLSIDGLPPVKDNDKVNKALLLVAGRIADLYMLLGNEAYADAADPTIAFGTDDGQYGAEASSIHCFMNVTSSLLEEELALLRGRDDSAPPGVKEHSLYNRLPWNFTNDLTGGEVAYALNYNIQDQLGNVDGKISEADAQRLYPQGHGDAWGHYLTAIKTYYKLLTHPNYKWIPRSEAVTVGSTPVIVDYLDERKFALAAAAKARTGAELVNLTYRSAYVENPAGQWQGYKDSKPERAWGLSEWGKRVGQGAYFDWVVGNAILPAADTVHTGIQKIDRKTVLELREVASRSQEIQAQVDVADLGLNPLGLATNVVPFDINPGEIDAGKTHFEQIYDRAVVAMNNAITVFNHANNSTQLLRRQADKQTEFNRNVEEREVDFKNRLIESFGYPYSDDIGPGKNYPTGYNGPDLINYTIVDASELTGEAHPPVKEIPLVVKSFKVQNDGSLVDQEKTVVFHFSTSADRFGLVKPPTWTGERRAPGEIQMAISDLIQARARFERALVEYNNLITSIEDEAKLLETQYNLNSEEINVLNAQLDRQERLNNLIKRSRSLQLDFQREARMATIVGNAYAEALPLSAGFAFDATSTIRSAIRLVGAVRTEDFTRDADQQSLVELDHQQASQIMQAQTEIVLTSLRSELPIQQQLKQLEQIVRQEVSQRFELYTMQEAMQQASGRYMAALAEGQRLLEDRSRFERQTAAEVQSMRYKDMAFRIFRNDALQKYRAQFDLAARYVYLAAKAYDYETTFLSSDKDAGQAFLTNIVHERLIGNISSKGEPLKGKGLADPMKQMFENFTEPGGFRSKLGFDNPQRETNRFSLRWELFRIRPGLEGNAHWRELLWQHVVPNLLDLPEFQRYCDPPKPLQPVEPAIVIPFETSICSGMNFFGREYGGGDNAYISTNFTTKVRSTGVWFSNYNNLIDRGMGNSPAVYLIPIGTDIQRSPTRSGEIREFNILDQLLPAPNQSIGGGDLNNPDWIPRMDNFKDTFAALRQYGMFRAYHDSDDFGEKEVQRDSRLIGRSVWNTKWLLIIPAVTLNSNTQEGLKTFIDGSLIGNVRDGNGVSDIKIFFETYAYHR